MAVTDQAAASAALDETFAAEIDTAREHLDVNADEARHSLRALPVTIVGLAVLAAVLALLGLQRRIREYR